MNYCNIFVLAISTQLLILSPFFLYRNHVICKRRCEAIDIIAKLAQMGSANGDHKWETWWKHCENTPSYETMFLCMLEKWSFKDLFPELHGIAKQKGIK